MNIADIFGYSAAAIGIFMFMPQAYQVFKTKNTKAISLPTFLLINTSSVLWIVYGVIQGAPPVYIVNIVMVVLNTYIILMKLKYR